MSKFLMAFGAFTVALSTGLAYEFISPVAGLMVGFGTITAVVIDETNGD